MNKYFSQSALLLSLALTATTASAHTGTHDINGFISGLSHPFMGLDHLLVMLGVGLYASRLNRISASLAIAAFLSFMGIGAGLALAGFEMQNVEIGILVSVLMTGLLLGTTHQLPSGMCAALVASFALFHGFAHGAEMPQATEPMNYAFGFLLATTLLHAIGLGFGVLLNKHQLGLKIAGFITSGLGLYLLINA
jgi:urease accessory protein